MPLYALLVSTPLILTLWVLHVIHTRTSPRSRILQRPELSPESLLHRIKTADSRRVSFTSDPQQPKFKRFSVDSASMLSSRSSLSTSTSTSSRASSKRLHLWRLRTHDLPDIPSVAGSTVEPSVMEHSRRSSIRSTFRRISCNKGPFSPRSDTGSSTPTAPQSPISQELHTPLLSFTRTPPSIHAVLADAEIGVSPKHTSHALGRIVRNFGHHGHAWSGFHHSKVVAAAIAVDNSKPVPSTPESPRTHHFKFSHPITHFMRRPHEQPRPASSYTEAGTWNMSEESSPYMVASPLPLSFSQDTDDLIATATRKLSAYASEERPKCVQPA